MSPYKFVTHEAPPLASLKGTDIYKLFGKKYDLSREEKDRLFGSLVSNSYSRTGVPFQGWMFPFGDVLNTYIAKVAHHGWLEVYAPNKSSIRAYYGSNRVLRIVELDKAAAA